MPTRLTDGFHLHQIFEDLHHQEQQEYYSAHGGVSSLHNTAISCVGFIRANPNDQIAFANETGLIPKEDNG
jgi:hypothetical protein